MENGACVIALHGEIDFDTRAELESTLCLFGHIFGRVVLDLSGLVFCDVFGLRVLYDVHECLLAVRARLTLRRPPPPLRFLLIVANLETTFDVEPDVEARPATRGLTLVD